MPKNERPRVVVVKHQGHGCIITVLLLIIAWPLAVLYWLVRVVWWATSSAIDWLTLGPLRRR